MPFDQKLIDVYFLLYTISGQQWWRRRRAVDRTIYGNISKGPASLDDHEEIRLGRLFDFVSQHIFKFWR